MPAGAAIRTGIWRTSRPSSATPPSCAPPPVRTRPAGSMPWPASRIRSRVSSKVSRIRASMIWQTSSRLISRPASSPRTETLICSSSSTVRRSHVPWRTLSSSAAWRLVLRPIATSLVTLLPPTGSTEVWRAEPSANRARSIVPAPMSATATPRSRSVSEATVSDEARALATSSSILTPAATTHLVRFWTAVAEAVTMWTSTPSRIALMPSGSLTPSWSSTLKSRGRTWRTSRFDGIWIARATSVARFTSSRVTSRSWPLTATVPGEFWLSTCWPPTATNARSIFMPDRRSACSTAWAIEWTVWSMLTTTPFLRPVAGTVPLPMIVRPPSRRTSPMSAQTLLVPTSIPTRIASRSTVRRRLAGSGLEEVASDEGHVVEDARAERDERHEVQVHPQPVADEGQEHGDDRVRDETADEDSIVVDPVELGTDRSQDRVERGNDRHCAVTGELEADVDLEQEPQQDAKDEARQGEKHACSPSLRSVWPRLLDPAEARQPATAGSDRALRPPSPAWVKAAIAIVALIGRGPCTCR